MLARSEQHHLVSDIPEEQYTVRSRTRREQFMNRPSRVVAYVCRPVRLAQLLTGTRHPGAPALFSQKYSFTCAAPKKGVRNVEGPIARETNRICTGGIERRWGRRALLVARAVVRRVIEPFGRRVDKYLRNMTGRQATVPREPWAKAIPRTSLNLVCAS